MWTITSQLVHALSDGYRMHVVLSHAQNNLYAKTARPSHDELIVIYQSGTTGYSGAYGRAAAVRGDGSVVVGGHTFGSFATDFVEDGATDFIAVALDEDGNELWRWQVILVSVVYTQYDTNQAIKL